MRSHAERGNEMVTRRFLRRSCRCARFAGSVGAPRRGGRAMWAAGPLGTLDLRCLGGSRQWGRHPGRVLVEIVVGWHVAGQFRAGFLLFIGLDHPLLDHLPAVRIDRVGDIGVELGPAFIVLRCLLVPLPNAALIAEGGPQMVLAAALRTVGRKLAAGHGHERPRCTFDDLQIANDESVVQRNRTESLQALSRFFHKLHAHLGDFHGAPPH